MSKFSVVIILFVSLLPMVSFADPTENITLQLRWLHQAQFAGYYMAKEKGYYTDAGLNVTISPRGAGKVPLREVSAKRAQFGVGNTEILIAYAHGLPLTALAAVYQQSPSILLTRQDSQINSVSELRGRKVMMFSGIEDAELVSLLKFHGLETSDLQQVPTSANLGDLINHQVDVYNAYSTNEPFLLEDNAIQPRIFDPKDVGINFYSDILFTHSDYAKNNPESVKRFVDASLLGWRYALTHIEETLDVIEANYKSGKTREHLRFELTSASNFIMPKLVDIGHMSQHRWQTIADQLAQFGLIPETTIDDQFLFPLNHQLNWEKVKSWFLPIGSAVFLLFSIIGYITMVNQKLKKEIKLRKTAENKAMLLAKKDMLTGIPNRYALMEELEKTITINQASPSISILFIDLDKFKSVNDTHGHHVGDKILQQFSFRISTCLPQHAFFARLAGDEFVILLREKNINELKCLIKDVNHHSQATFVIGEKRIHIGASVGVSHFKKGDSADALLTRADHAMYHQKRKESDLEPLPL